MTDYAVVPFATWQEAIDFALFVAVLLGEKQRVSSPGRGLGWEVRSAHAF